MNEFTSLLAVVFPSETFKKTEAENSSSEG